MELNGKPVDGEVFPSTNISIGKTELMVRFNDDTKASEGDVLTMGTGEKRIIEQEVSEAGKGRSIYQLSSKIL